MFGSILILFLVPGLTHSRVRSAVYRPWYQLLFWLFVADCIFLGWLGAKPAEGGYSSWRRSERFTISLSSSSSCLVLGLIETPKRLPNSITEAVLEKKRAAPAVRPDTAAATPETGSRAREELTG